MNRPDFNIALFSFGYLLWDQKNTMHKVRMSYLIVFTLFVDLVWLIYWGSFWDKSIFEDKWNKGIHTFVIIVNLLNFFFKICAVVTMFISDQQIRYAFMPLGLFENIKGILIHSQPNDQLQYYY